MKLEEVLHAHARVAIVGSPGTGKTTLGQKRSDCVSVSDFQAHGWKGSANAALRSVFGRESYVLEGVTAANAVRAQPQAFDVVIVMETAKAPRYKSNITKGVRTILSKAPSLKVVYESECDG